LSGETTKAVIDSEARFTNIKIIGNIGKYLLVIRSASDGYSQTAFSVSVPVQIEGCKGTEVNGFSDFNDKFTE
jgi:hypothetical protein